MDHEAVDKRARIQNEIAKLAFQLWEELPPNKLPYSQWWYQRRDQALADTLDRGPYEINE